MDIDEPKRVKQKSAGRKVRIVVHWQEALKQWRKTRPWCILISFCDKLSANQSLTIKPNSKAVRHFYYCSHRCEPRHRSADANKRHKQR